MPCRRLALTVLLEAFAAPLGVGRRLRTRLHEVRRIDDHRGHVALIGAAEIVILLVLEVARIVDRRSEVLRPEPARAGLRLHAGIADAHRRHVLGILGMIGPHRDRARRHAGDAERRLDLAHGIGGGPRIRGVDRHVDIDHAGAGLHPGLRHAHHVGALLGGQPAAAASDEHDDGLIGFLDRDRMAQAIVFGNAHDDFAIVVVDAGTECDGNTDQRPRHAEAATKALGCPGCHWFKSRLSR